MEIFKRLKPFKADTPFNTIHKIRDILRNCNIFTTESHFKEENLNLFSSRVEIADAELGTEIIGTNGKGMTTEYSLASAYAEFMERLQNGFLFPFQKYASKNFLSLNTIHPSYKKKLAEKNLILDFEIAPDEKYFTPKELVSSSFEIIKFIFKIEDKRELLRYLEDTLIIDKITCVPFFDVKNNSICYIPKRQLDQVCISTGLCAGNTKQEAIIQGVCEIFERYAIKIFYSKRISPPTIPHEYFKNNYIYKKIKTMEKLYDCSVIIKDCSLGIDLPIIGILIIDRKYNKYTFKLGSDPSTITSVERCLTEIFQGGDYKTILTNRFKNLDLGKDFSKFTKKEEKRFQHLEYKKTVLNGSGEWPFGIFLDNESYSINDFKYNITTSDKDDLKYILKKIFDLGFELYIRDVSYLGFPSFQIYIPKMSELLEYSDKEFEVRHILRKKIKILFNIKNESEKKLKELALLIDEIYENEVDFDVFKLFLNNSNKDFNYLNNEIFLMALFYRINDYDRAIKYINKFLEHINYEERPENIYYYCIRDYLKMKRDNFNIVDIKETLTLIYGEEEVKNFINEFAKPKEVFKKFKFPSCFHCDKCEIIENCKYFNFLKYAKILQEKYKSNVIEQSFLKEIFL